MKILIALRKLEGGVGRANTEIAKSLRKKGHSIDFLSRDDDLKIYSLFKSFFPLRRKVKELMKKKKYDIVYTQDYSMAFPLLFPYPLFWKKHFCCFCGVKRGDHPDYSKTSQFQNKITHRIVGKIMGKRLIVIGDRLKEMFPKATLIYRGVNIKNFKPLKKKRDSLGWYHSDNEAISKKEIEEISKKTGLKLLIAKNIPKNKMNEFYNKCLVFINLPLSAGFNLSWLEAMSAGVPIVIGNYEGSGRIFPFNKVEDKKDNINEIIKIIKNPKKINYRKWLIKKEFVWERKAEELIKFFEKNLENE